MRKSTRNELGKLRELVHFLIEGKCCFFCHKPLITEQVNTKHGDSAGSPLKQILKVAIHHMDGDHYNDERANKRLAHQSCHKRFHMKERWKSRKQKSPRSE